jgi:hypothetical protein
MSYATVAQVKTYLGISAATDDALIADLLASASQAIDTLTHTTFAAQVNATRYFDSCDDVEGLTLMLDNDLCAIASITNGDGSTVISGRYVTNPRNTVPYYSISLKVSYGLMWTADNNGDSENAIAISGKWGYSQTPPPDIEQACLRLASYYYRQKDSQVFDVTATPELGQITIPQGVPPDVTRLIKPYIRYA